MNNYKNWELKRDKDCILWLGIIRNGAPVNTINEEVLDELNSILHEISLDKKAIGLIIYSLKEKGFIAGADVNAFSKFETPAQAVDFLQKGRQIFYKKGKRYSLVCRDYPFLRLP